MATINTEKNVQKSDRSLQTFSVIFVHPSNPAPLLSEFLLRDCTMWATRSAFSRWTLKFKLLQMFPNFFLRETPQQADVLVICFL